MAMKISIKKKVMRELTKEEIEVGHKISYWLEHNSCGSGNALAHRHKLLRLKAQE